jgi:hypothetical protein
MQLVSYDQIVRQVAQLLGEDAALLDAQRWREIRDAVGHSLERWWTHAWWPGIMRVEKRPLRTPYSATTTYAAASEVWYEPAGKYYQSLRETTGNAPATYDGTEWDETSTYWAECKVGYAADDYSATTAYVAGDQVFYPQTGRYYQAFASTTGNAPTDTNKWGVLTNFIPSLPRTMAGYFTIGHVKAIYDVDPRVSTAALTLDFTETHDAWMLHDVGFPLPWVEYRRRCPVLDAEAFSSTASYTPADGDAAVEDSVEIVTDSRLFREFSTVDDMLAADSTTFRFAHCFNYAGTDGVNSTWVRTAESGLVDAGGDVRQMTDGAWVRRTYTDP